MSNWEIVTLDDVAESINTGLDAIRRAPIVSHKTDLRCLRIQDISQNKPFDKWGYTEVKDTDFKKFQLVPNDIIMARTCSTGICYLVKEELPAVFNNGLARIRLKIEKVDPQFIYYIFKSKHFSGYIDGISGGTSVQLNMKIGDLSKYQFKLPPLSEQKEIARILSDLDKKIEINTQINQTLEQIAQAIFKSWFVDFDPVRAKAATLASGKTDAEAELAAMQAISGKTAEELAQMPSESYAELVEIAKAFPSEFGEDGVPMGWEVCTFGDVSECFDSKRIPLSKQQREKRKGSIPYYGATSVMDYVDEAIFDGIYLLIGEDGSVLKEDGTPFTQYIWGQSWVNNHAHAINGKNGVSTEHLMLFIQQTNITAYITGAVQLKLNQKNMNSIPFIKASNEVNMIFAKYIEPLYARVRKNSDENKVLESTRDLLLPRLLNGEIQL
ncbi:restriction endonuclease subunit S [Aggregatibacter actinomycetemcomitans]|uniref:restriction endonuclease subunit S n=1 Tax=Aggregatibacter actinomycetemcomitans TaxID=714 RepID=UPI00197BA464|nr:restriction endonuclease subunit S [Aggregatibacter actinomycetemcomitans]MBN6076861.1 restriction endonuclease subunit S [Aggregatibacter actinomycetemcomitans]